MKRRAVIGLLAALSVVLIPGIVSAHVIVTPGQANVAQELVFNVSVPNEKEVPVTNIKLLIPAGVTNVLPTSMSGWTITTTMNGNSADPEVAAIAWSGTIPVGQRQDFSFGAQVPGQAAELDWKAYQTYADGTVVHWDQKPAGSDDATGSAGPYSVTHVVNDLTAAPASTWTTTDTAMLALVLSIAAVILSAGGLLMRRRG